MVPSSLGYGTLQSFGFLAFDADIFGYKAWRDSPSRAKVALGLDEKICKAGVRFGQSFMSISRFAISGSEKNTATSK
jgi:hypothetical protein